MCCSEHDEGNNSQQKTEETRCVFKHIIEEVSDRKSDAEGNTINNDVPFIKSVSYPDVFSYHWIGSILFPIFVEQGLKKDLSRAP